MKTDKNVKECCGKLMSHHGHHRGGGSGAIYSMGVIGSLFYFLQDTGTFSTVIVGIGKALFWPAFLIFKLLAFLKV